MSSDVSTMQYFDRCLETSPGVIPGEWDRFVASILSSVAKMGAFVNWTQENTPKACRLVEILFELPKVTVKKRMLHDFFHHLLYLPVCLKLRDVTGDTFVEVQKAYAKTKTSMEVGAARRELITNSCRAILSHIINCMGECLCEVNRKRNKGADVFETNCYARFFNYDGNWCKRKMVQELTPPQMKNVILACDHALVEKLGKKRSNPVITVRKLEHLIESERQKEDSQDSATGPHPEHSQGDGVDITGCTDSPVDSGHLDGTESDPCGGQLPMEGGETIQSPTWIQICSTESCSHRMWRRRLSSRRGIYGSFHRISQMNCQQTRLSLSMDLTYF